jgi:hypothetical protein
VIAPQLLEPVSQRRAALADPSTHSHSIINGVCKPLIRLYDISNRAGFTVTCTVTLTGIPSRSFHHLSTSIEDSRRFHNRSLSRSIAIYRFAACDPAGGRSPSVS